jgi:DNA-binding NarL/FixJ family response regulator
LHGGRGAQQGRRGPSPALRSSGRTGSDLPTELASTPRQKVQLREIPSPAMAPPASRPSLDRVTERRRAVALARHYREAEGLSIAQIAERLGRSPATVKAYFYDPSDANKGLSRELVAKAGGREV